jgi:hypothetical protein
MNPAENYVSPLLFIYLMSVENEFFSDKDEELQLYQPGVE